MATRERVAHATHEVTNQSLPLEGYNVFTSDRVLREAVSREGGDFALETVNEVGRRAGEARAIEAGFLADQNKPELRIFDRFGHRIDEVSFHPAWHELMALHVEHGTHALPWRDSQPGAHVARAAAFMCMSATDAGPGCPISMTYSVIPALRKQPELAEIWEPRFTSLSYDPRMIPAEEKSGAL
jgi:putative acyl-CoA dehydrogenase